MKNTLLDLNLQFFADGEVGAEEQEAADPVTDVTEDSSTSTEETEITDNTESTEPSNVQSAEENAKYAAARRRAEAEFYQKQQAMDAEFAKRFEGCENPITHQPIMTQKDYFDALDAQATLEELSKHGVGYEAIKDVVKREVEHNPIVQQAQAVLAQAQKAQLESELTESVKAISLLNPNVKTVEDFFNLPNAKDVTDMVLNSGGKISLADAYKLVNFDSLMAGKVAGAKQAALNNINGTAHLNQTDNIAPADNGEVEIPQSELAQWKRAFPHATHAELRKKYNSTL